MLAERILDELFPGQPGPARLRLLGLFIIVQMLQGDAEPVTTSRIATLTSAPAAGIRREIRKLAALGLLERVHAPSARGGRAWSLAVKPHAQTKLVAAAIGYAGARLKRPRRLAGSRVAVRAGKP